MPLNRLITGYCLVLFALVAGLAALPWATPAAFAAVAGSASNADVGGDKDDPGDEEDPGGDDDPPEPDSPLPEPEPTDPPISPSPPSPPPDPPPEPPPPPDDGDSPDDDPDEPDEPTTSDPVGYVSGNVYEAATDLRIPCPDVDLVFRRSYSSHSDVTGDLGYGWSHSYDWRVFSMGDRVVVRASGAGGASDTCHTFKSVRAGQAVSNAGGFWLSRREDGRYVLTTPDKTRYAFAKSGRLASVTTWNGTRVEVLRDGDGRILSVRHSSGRALSFVYSGDALVRVETPDSGVRVEFEQRAFGAVRRLERVVRHDGGRASTNVYEYVGRPRPGTWRTPASLRAAYYWSAGGSSAATLGGAVVRASVPVLSRKTDANGVSASYSYDRLTDGPKVRCRSMEMTGGLFATELSYYDGYTVESKATAFGTSKTLYGYDSERRETERRTGGELLLTSYDAQGNVAWTVRTNAQHSLSVLRAYDGRHRNVSVATGFDAAPARATRFGWDEVRGVVNRVVTPEGRVREWTTNGYDVVEHGAGRGDARLVTYRVCDTNGHVRAVLGPDGGRTDVSYHADGSVAAVEAEGLSRVSFAYDAATGWLDASRGADGSRVRYVRSNGGAVTSVVSVAGTSAHVLDVAGRRVRTDSPAGRIAFGYCPWNGLLAAVTNANGVVAEFAYDVMDRVTNIVWTAAGGRRLGGFAYRYDAAGRVVSRRHALGTNVFDRVYGYDGLDRLVADGDIFYEYDAAGNRLSKRGGAEGDVEYRLGVGDRLASWTGGSCEHDAAGCATRIVRGGTALGLAWNGQRQLVSVSTNGVFAESYAYDALGRRVRTTNAEGTTRHVYDENWQVIADVAEDGTVLRSYVWGDGVDRLLAVKVGDRTFAALTDVQGTVWGYADERGEVVARWTYDAWGNVLSEDVAASASELRAVRYRFQGRERSAATGLVNFRMRWYDPDTGRWLSKDPIGLGGGLNLYAFCLNSAINNIDPSGAIVPLPIIGGVVGGVVGGIAGGFQSMMGGGSFWKGAASGAISGAISGATMGFLTPIIGGVVSGAVAGALSGAIGGAAGGVADRLMCGDDSSNWGWSVGLGAAGGALSGGFSGYAGEAGSSLVNALIDMDIAIWQNIKE